MTTKTRKTMTLNHLIDWYFEHYAKNHLKEVTQYNYKGVTERHIRPKLGRKKLHTFDNIFLTEYFGSLNVSAATARSIYVVLRSIFSMGTRMGFLEKNPCANVILPRMPEQVAERKPALDMEQAKELMAMTSEYTPFNCMVQFLLLTGMRSGEAFGLQWEDIDFDAGIIHIRHNLANVASKHWLDTPKTKNSIRKIGMSGQLRKLLLKHRAEQAKVVNRLGKNFEHPEMVFTSAKGHYADHNYIEKKFKKFVAGTTFEDITLHSLRHANATLMLANGVDLKVVSSLLGHSTVAITADIYADTLATSKAIAAQTVALQLYA